MTKSGTLYLCATPIGNLGDISFRALEILKNVDLIACEDTRHSQKLLTHFGISKPTTSYFEHNRLEKGEQILKVLKEGKDVALITDAGTPAISDPGEELVRQCAQADIRVVPIPGPAALISALVVSGLPTGRFSFEGFLSVNKKSRAEHLTQIEKDTRTLIFYEAPHKLLRTLNDLLAVLGDREICLVRELTKVHEEVRRTTLLEAAAYYAENPPRGEFVLVVAGADEAALQAQAAAAYADIGICAHVDSLIAQGMDKKDAIKEVAQLRGLKKRDVYNQYERADD